MLVTTPDQDVRSLGLFLADSGYDADHLSSELELADGLYATGENLEPLLFKTEGDALLPVLARLFFVGLPVAETRCARVIPPDILSLATSCGVLARAAENLEPCASLIPFRGNLISCDCARLRGANSEMVMGPASSTQFIARLAAGGQHETTLDIGFGSGVLTVEAAAYSQQVTGTDINARCLQFASFTAALNGVTNAKFLQGDAFTPVAGRRFSRIVANPPFFLSPGKKYTYCDSPLELDGFARRLALESPAHLEEGGYFQMICQWVDLENQPWQRRLREWTAASGCDVLVLLAPRQTPVAYAEVRDREARQTYAAAPEFDFASRVGYLRDRGVTSILSGVISMRKRSGRNWFSVVDTAPAGPNVGSGVRERFETLTFLATRNDSDIFETRFQFTSDVLLETIAELPGPHAKTPCITLVKSETLVDRLRLDEAVAGCLPFFDGHRTLLEISEAVSGKLSISPDESRRCCLQLARRLLQSSYVLPV